MLAHPRLFCIYYNDVLLDAVRSYFAVAGIESLLSVDLAELNAMLSIGANEVSITSMGLIVPRK